jgi:nucleoside phosphorylase
MQNRRKGIATHADGWLVVAAFAPELAFLEAALPQLPARIRRRLRLATLGVGLVEAGIGASRLLAEARPRAIVLVGTAGVYPAWSSRLAVGQAVVINKTKLLPEILPGENAYLPAVIPRQERSSPTLSRALRKATGLAQADVACPLAITRSRKAAKAAATLSGCALENLEAFAVARAAARARIPFAAVLGIANCVGPDGHREWKKHAKLAAESACRAVLDTLATVPTRQNT